MLVKNLDGSDYCYPESLVESLNCSRYSLFIDKIGELFCDECSEIFYLKYTPKSEEEFLSVCLPWLEIPNCTTYNSDSNRFYCEDCDLDYYNANKHECVLRNPTEFCFEYQKFSEDCKACHIGYFLNSSKKCLPIPLGLPFCRIYKSESECDYCLENRYIKDGQCVLLKTEEKIIDC